MTRFLNRLLWLNALLLLGGAAWLWQTGRLDLERLREITAMLATPAGAEAATSEETDDTDAPPADGPPPDGTTSVQRVRHQQRAALREQQQRQRLEDERRMLQQELNLAVDLLNRLQADIDKERAAHREAAERAARRRNDEQFRQIVTMYESIPPKQAKDMLILLMRDGKRDDAIAYLNAMQDRPKSKILAAFKTDAELALATELLEGLKSLEPAPEPTGDNADADDPGPAPDP